ncbi:MAG: hypothetical protein ACJAS1_004666 [Oleiphilaceae bacterium]|jgi:hypothetical protein
MQKHKVLLAACWPSDTLVHQIGTLDRNLGTFKNEAVANAHEDVSLAKTLSSQGMDTYFSIAEFATIDNRKADNVVGACCFWLDIDCGEEKVETGKGCLNKEEALAALTDFYKAVRVPGPTYIIDSGNGLHPYWESEDLV